MAAVPMPLLPGHLAVDLAPDGEADYQSGSEQPHNPHWQDMGRIAGARWCDPLKCRETCDILPPTHAMGLAIEISGRELTTAEPFCSIMASDRQLVSHAERPDGFSVTRGRED